MDVSSLAARCALARSASRVEPEDLITAAEAIQTNGPAAGAAGGHPARRIAFSVDAKRLLADALEVARAAGRSVTAVDVLTAAGRPTFTPAAAPPVEDPAPADAGAGGDGEASEAAVQAAVLVLIGHLPRLGRDRDRARRIVEDVLAAAEPLPAR